MKTGTFLAVMVFSVSMLVGCTSGGKQGSVQGYSSAEQEKAMVEEMNLHRAGKTGTKAASREDSAALRETITEHPVRSKESQAAGGTVNEMVEGEGLPRPTEEQMSRQQRTMVTPVEPAPGDTMARSSTGESKLGPQGRSDQEVTLRRDTETLPHGAESAEITRYEPDFRQNYESNFANTGYGYDQYRPAYHYGFELAKDPRYNEMEWNSLELQAHRNWNETTMGPWDRYKDAVHYGWERGRQSTPGRG